MPGCFCAALGSSPNHTNQRPAKVTHSTPFNLDSCTGYSSVWDEAQRHIFNTFFNWDSPICSVSGRGRYDGTDMEICHQRRSTFSPDKRLLKKKKRSSAQCAVLRKVEWLNEGAYSRECVQHEVDVRNFTSESGGRGCIYDFNSLISRLCHYYAIASEKFICFLWSAVDGRMMKHKPCFWRNAPQSGPCTRLPALDYNWAPARCCAQPHLGQTEKPRVDGVSSVE